MTCTLYLDALWWGWHREHFAEPIADVGLRLAGSLPASWKDMTSLVYIDISHDNLTGVLTLPQCRLGRKQDL